MAAQEQVVTPESEDTQDGERSVSTIGFPWADLENATRVAKAIHKVGGTTLTQEQLGAELEVNIKAGGFRMLTSSAKMFGLVTGSSNLTLTPLGRRLNDTKEEKAAKAEAFLTVPLYRAIYDKYKGGILPPAAALETEMFNLGVVRKATERARQVFQKSALQAGFFGYGNDRLVMPATGVAHPTPQNGHPQPEDPKLPDRHKIGGDGGGGGRHPFIEGLLKELPSEGADWPTPDRVKWLKAAAMLFDFIYKSGDSGRQLRIEVSTDSAK
jgi:hypothetical protein